MIWDLGYELITLMACLAQLGLCILLFRRKLVREWQGLFTLCLVQAASDLSLACLRHDYRAYFYTYWTTRMILAMLQVYLIADILRALPGRVAISYSSRWIFGLAALALALGAFHISWTADSTLGQHLAASAILLSRSVDITWGVFATVCIASVGILGMGWKLQPAKVTSGFVAAMVCRIACGYAYASNITFVRVYASALEAGISAFVAIYWLVAFAKPELERSLTTGHAAVLRRQLADTLSGPIINEGSHHA